MTVHELAELLRDLPEDLPVIVSYDDDCAEGEVMGTTQEPDRIVLKLA